MGEIDRDEAGCGEAGGRLGGGLLQAEELYMQKLGGMRKPGVGAGIVSDSFVLKTPMLFPGEGFIQIKFYYHSELLCLKILLVAQLVAVTKCCTELATVTSLQGAFTQQMLSSSRFHGIHAFDEVSWSCAISILFSRYARGRSGVILSNS